VIQLVLLMAGRGERFSQKGYQVPKPLLCYQGRPFFQWALQSMGFLTKTPVQLSMVVCEEDQLRSEIQAAMRDFPISYQVIELPNRTRGPAETARLALTKMPATGGTLLIADCDLWLRCEAWEKTVLNWPAFLDAGLLYFQANSERYSYLQIRSTGQVTAIAEKKVISNHAVAGIYSFRNQDLFQNTYDQIQWPEDRERYISNIFHDLLAENRSILGFPVEDSLSMGTPEEIGWAFKSGEPF
jgi:NDP-sugar pyrophosphorylase family protein